MNHRLSWNKPMKNNIQYILATISKNNIWLVLHDIATLVAGRTEFVVFYIHLSDNCFLNKYVAQLYLLW